MNRRGRIALFVPAGACPLPGRRDRHLGHAGPGSWRRALRPCRRTGRAGG